MNRTTTVPVMTMGLKAPVELFARLDRWREQQIARPSRPASIRWIVWNYLQEQEAKPKRRGKKSRLPRPA